MIDRFEAIWDSKTPYKSVRVSQTVLSEYMPPSVKPSVSIIVSTEEDTVKTAVRVMVDPDIEDNRLHFDPSTATDIGLEEEGDTKTITINQPEVILGEEIVFRNSSPVSSSIDKNSTVEFLMKKSLENYFVIGETIFVPEEVAGDQLELTVSGYTASGSGDDNFMKGDMTAVYISRDSSFTLEIAGDDVKKEENKQTSNKNPQMNSTNSKVQVTGNPGANSEELMEELMNYDSVGGLDEEVDKVKELVERPLQDPGAFQGVSTPSGVLLYGPPGTGKTLLAEAVANEVNASFYALSGSEIFGSNYGESEQNLRSLFTEAEENTPSIIFIDELESIVPSRDELSLGNQVEKRVVNQLKTLMDGFSSTQGLIVIGATNHIKEIDESFLRPGRFDRKIHLGVPDEEGRKEIFQIHMRDMKLDFGEEYLQTLVEKTTGFTGADIEGLCLQANMEMQRRLIREYPNYQGEKAVSEILLREDEGYKPEDFEKALENTQPSLLEHYDIDIPKVTWEDIGGYSNVKQRIQGQVDGPLKAPHLWSENERSAGMLLYGPPGTGKTLLAKAMATESDRVFIGVQATELRSKWVGETEKAVRRLFSLAESLEPSIVYIDEVEAITRKRGSSQDTSGVDSSTTSQLLSELDGLEDRGDVIVVGSTNADYDPEKPLQDQEVQFGLDSAILRPGRLEKHYHIGLPGKEDRKEIFDIHLQKVSEDENVTVQTDVDTMSLAEITPDVTGADIEGICWEAKNLARDRKISRVGGIQNVSDSEIMITKEDINRAIKEYNRESMDAVATTERMYR